MESADFMSHLSALNIHADFRPVPDEVSDPIPFAEDTAHSAYEPECQSGELVYRTVGVAMPLGSVVDGPVRRQNTTTTSGAPMHTQSKGSLCTFVAIHTNARAGPTHHPYEVREKARP